MKYILAFLVRVFLYFIVTLPYSLIYLPFRVNLLTLILTSLLITTGIFLHEFGHTLAYRLHHVRSRIVIPNPFDIFVESTTTTKHLTASNRCQINLAGVYSSLLFTLPLFCLFLSSSQSRPLAFMLFAFSFLNLNQLISNKGNDGSNFLANLKRCKLSSKITWLTLYCLLLTTYILFLFPYILTVLAAL